MTNTSIRSRPPRLTVPVDPETQATFERLARLTGMSTGKCIAEWLADTRVAAEDMARQVAQIRTTPARMVERFTNLANGLEDASQAIIDQVKRGPDVGRGAPPAGSGPRPSGPLTPPSSNTGGKVTIKPNAGGKH